MKEDEAYPSVLEVLLNQSTAERSYEVLNLAVGGYSTRDEALVLEHKGLQWDIDRLGNEDYFKYIHSPETRQWQSVRTAFDSIGNIAREQDIPVLLIVFPHVYDDQSWVDYPYKEQHTQVTDAAETQGFYVRDLLDTYEQTPASVLTLSKTDPHPSFIGHQLSAQAIYAWLLDHPDILSN